MENKYFTPEISDIRVGYECELLWNQNMLPEENWYPIKIWEDDTEEFDLIDWIGKIANSKLRVPYLTKEQIKKEGWLQITSSDLAFKFVKGEYNLEFISGVIQGMGIYSSIGIWIQGNSGRLIRYIGECPSINEFRTLMKWLKINE